MGPRPGQPARGFAPIGQAHCARPRRALCSLRRGRDATPCHARVAPNVVLDLGGHTLTGPSYTSDGVFIEPGATNARVLDGTVINFNFGVADNGSGAVIQRVTAHRNNIGIAVGDVLTLGGGICSAPGCYPVAGSVLSNGRALGNGSGIELFDASAVTVASSTTSGGIVGIDLDAPSSRDRVVGNAANNNEANGIFVDTSATHHQLAGNKATGNGFVDLEDFNPGCDSNQRVGNTFGTSDPASCIH